MDQLFATWVKPFYLEILGGGFTRLHGTEQKRFVSDVNNARSHIDESVIERLLLSSCWRQRITGGWFSGLMKWNKFEHRIGELLVESDRLFADQGYCFALGRFADAASVDYLVRYLDKYLLQLECFYHQDWAMSALMWIDGIHGSQHSAKYLTSYEPWERFWERCFKHKPQWSLELCRSQYASIMRFCAENFDDI